MTGYDAAVRASVSSATETKGSLGHLHIEHQNASPVPNSPFFTLILDFKSPLRTSLARPSKSKSDRQHRRHFLFDFLSQSRSNFDYQFSVKTGPYG